MQRTGVRRHSGRAGTDGGDIVGGRPVERSLAFEHAASCVLRCALTDGRGVVVQPIPAARGVSGGHVQGVRGSSIATTESGNGDGVLLADDVVGAARAVGSEVGVGVDIEVEALVSTEMTAFEDGQR